MRITFLVDSVEGATGIAHPEGRAVTSIERSFNEVSKAFVQPLDIIAG